MAAFGVPLEDYVRELLEHGSVMVVDGRIVPYEEWHL